MFFLNILIEFPSDNSILSVFYPHNVGVKGNRILKVRLFAGKFSSEVSFARRDSRRRSCRIIVFSENFHNSFKMNGTSAVVLSFLLVALVSSVYCRPYTVIVKLNIRLQ